ncbi:MOG protein, partial [Eurystomus gularis]|nr:MOG protein [Eurystomus gularis]
LLSFLGSLHLLQLGSADFRVVGPGHPLHATVGQDIVLPCHLSPSMDARSLEIRWIRYQFSEIVHQYQNGQDQHWEQMQEYVGRTELDKDGLSSGILDLRIVGLRPSDEGQYVCTVRDAASYGEATVDLEVAGAFFQTTHHSMAALIVFIALSLLLTAVTGSLLKRKMLLSRELGESFWPLPPSK